MNILVPLYTCKGGIYIYVYIYIGRGKRGNGEKVVGEGHRMNEKDGVEGEAERGLQVSRKLSPPMIQEFSAARNGSPLLVLQAFQV